MLLQGEPLDAAVNFGTHQSLQWHRAVSLPQHSFLVQHRPTSVSIQTLKLHKVR